MRFCADSSFVVRLYDPLTKPVEAESIRAYLADDEKVVAISALCRVEILNVLLRKPETGAAKKFEEDLVEGLRLRLEPVDWLENGEAATRPEHPVELLERLLLLFDEYEHRAGGDRIN